ncbi:hypothetical protein N0V90_007536 [Kalmusia sp. IMI 367209]|nr:hypothetical protein N0V90_007536 [Kalmusia sp. IMI 367209]
MVLFSQTREEKARKRAATFERMRREQTQQRSDRPAQPPKLNAFFFKSSKKTKDVPFSNKKLANVVRGVKPRKMKASDMKVRIGGAEGGGEMELREGMLVERQADDVQDEAEIGGEVERNEEAVDEGGESAGVEGNWLVELFGEESLEEDKEADHEKELVE